MGGAAGAAFDAPSAYDEPPSSKYVGADVPSKLLLLVCIVPGAAMMAANAGLKRPADSMGTELAVLAWLISKQLHQYDGATHVPAVHYAQGVDYLSTWGRPHM